MYSVLNTYASNAAADRKVFFRNLLKLVIDLKMGSNIIIGCDFNTALEWQDKQSNCPLDNIVIY